MKGRGGRERLGYPGRGNSLCKCLEAQKGVWEAHVILYGGAWVAVQGVGQTVGEGWCVKHKSYEELMNDSEKHCHSNNDQICVLGSSL